MAVYGPDSAWPRHPRKEMNATLSVARQHDWWLKTSDRGHIFGTISCHEPGLLPACREKIFSTGHNSDGAALTIRSNITGCPHPRPDEDELKRVRRQLERAAFGLRGIQHALDIGIREAELDELWREVERTIEHDELLASIIELEGRNEKDSADLMRAIEALDDDDIDPASTASELLTAVDRLLKDAAEGIARLDRDRRLELRKAWKRLHRASAQVRAQIDRRGGDS